MKNSFRISLGLFILNAIFFFITKESFFIFMMALNGSTALLALRIIEAEERKNERKD
jgi:hypothetical protein